MKKVRKISREYYLRQIVACWLVTCMLFAIPAQVAMALENPASTALPSGLHPGSIGVDDPMTVGNNMSINQTASEAIMNWDNFDIGSDATVTFNQLVTDAVLNRVWDGDVTGIMGGLSGNGSVFIINPAGIVFGQGAIIDVGQLVASSLDILDADFLNRSYTFFEDPILGAGQVINYSTDTINADRIALIGKQVINRGSLVSDAPDGYVIMAAGQTVTITENSPVSVVVTLPDGVDPGNYEYWVDNGGGPFSIVDDGDGTIEADHVILAAGDIWSAAIEGVETLRAEAKGNVVFTGNILAGAEAASDAVSDVTIISGGDLVVDYDIQVEAFGNGVDNAIASVNLTSTGGSVTVKSDGESDTEISALAEDGLNNTATVNITAADDASVLSQGGDATVRAEADSVDYDGVLNQANVNITGKNVTVKGENIPAGNDDALVKAWAKDAEQNKATVTIVANGIVEGDAVIEGDVTVVSEGWRDDAMVEAIAEKGTTNTALVDIDAVQSVSVIAEADSATIQAIAKDGTTNKATVEILAGSDVRVEALGQALGHFYLHDEAMILAKAEEGTTNTALVDIDITETGDSVSVIAQKDSAAIKAVAQEGTTNTATVDILAPYGVYVTANDGAAISALAQNDIEILEDDGNPFVLDGLSNTATVNINARNVNVTAVDCKDDAVIEAVAVNEIAILAEEGDEFDVTVQNLTNDADVKITATEGVLVQGGETEMVGNPPEEGETTLGDAEILAEAGNVIEVGEYNCFGDDYENFILNLAVNNLMNTADVDITADNVQVIADGSWSWFWMSERSDALILAEAYNEVQFGSPWDFGFGGSFFGGVEGVTLNLTADLLSNTANVLIDTDTTEGTNVEVAALHGGFASIRAEAYNEVEGDVGVAFSGDDGGNNEVYVTADNLANVALVDIDAGDDVLVSAECFELDSEAEIYAEAWNDIPGELINDPDPVNITNNANVNIDATNVDVKSIDGGKARIIAEAYDGTTDTAGVTINADGNVEVMHNEDAEAVIKAIATSPWGDNNTATVDIIDAYANLLIDNGYVGAWAEGGLATATVTVDTANVQVTNGEIVAEAQSYFDDEGGALATVDITTRGFDGVVVEDGSSIRSNALALDSGNATATTTVIAGDGDVTVDNSEITADSQSLSGSGNATSSVVITATTGDVDISSNGNTIRAEAEVESPDSESDGDATATVTITATAGDVDIDDYVKAEADAENNAGDATATVNIIATDGSVTIHDKGAQRSNGEYVVKADAWVDEDSGDATANLNITAGEDVDIFDDVAAEADTRDNSGNAVSKAEIIAGGDVEIDDGFKARSEAVESGNATADTKITGENLDLDGWVVNRAITDHSNSGDADAVGNIVITARGDLYVNGVKSKVASVKSGDATSDIKISGVNIDAGWILSKATAGLNLIEGGGDTSGHSGDATAGVDIAASGSVTVDDRVQSYAEAENNSGSASATTKIVGTEISIEDGGGGQESLSVSAKAETRDNSGNANASVDIDATTGDVIIDTDGYTVLAEASVENPDDEYDGDATASVNIDAAGSVEILSTEVEAEAETYFMLYVDSDMLDEDDRNDDVADVIDLTVSDHVATATVDITATDGDVEIIGNSEAGVKAKATNEVEIDISAGSFDDDVTVNLTVEDLEANAGVTITANEDVYIEADGGDAQVKAEAKNEFEAMGDEGDLEVDVALNLTVNTLETNTLVTNANVDITATNGDVEILGGSDAGVKVKATTEIDDMTEYIDVTETVDNLTNNATVNVTAAGDVDVIDAEIGAEAQNKGEKGEDNEKPAPGSEDYQPTNWVNNANVNITAEDGDVTVDGGDGVESKALFGTENNANVVVNASGDVTVDNSDVEAKAKVREDEHQYNSGDATATVTIGAANLTVDHEGTIEAEAEAHAGKADADVGITLLESDLLLKNGSEIDAEAETEHGEGNATADVTILAANVTLSESEIEAKAEAEKGAGDATATVDITLTGSDVLMEQSKISAEAEAEKGSGDADATVNIVNADNVTVTDDSEIEAEAEAEKGSGDAAATVTVDAANVTVSDDSEIEADAETEYGSGDATALVSIDADGNVLVEFDSAIIAWAETYNYDSGNATATVDIDAGGSVSVIGHEPDDDGSSKIMAHAMTEQPKWDDSVGSATADVDINAGGAVTASEDGKIAAVALVLSRDGGQTTALQVQDPDPVIEPLIIPLPRYATATVDIDAGGDVTVEKGSEVKAVAKIENMGTSDLASLENGDNGDGIDEIVVIVPGDATASVDILAGGDVTVSMGGEVSADAKIYNNAQYPLPSVDSLNDGEDGPSPLGDATATVDILAGGKVTVDKGGEVGAYARIDNYVSFYHDVPALDYPTLPDLGDATANVNILAGGDVTVSKGGEVYADAELYNSGGASNSDVGALNGGLELPGLGDATAGIEITTPGSLTVDKGGEVYAEASIEYDVGEIQPPSIGALLNGEVDEDSGDATASVNIKAREGVTVGERSEIAADAWIDSYAFGVISDSGLGPIPDSAPLGDAFASVDILTCGDVIVDGLVGAYADIDTQLILPGDIPTKGPVYSGDTSADVLIRAYGDVIVNSEKVEEELNGDFVESGAPSFGGQILAEASNGEENYADITILAVGDVIVNDGSGPMRRGEIDSSGPFVELYSPEEILANAYGGYTNDAFVGIATRGGGLNPDSSPGDVIVSGQIGARTSEAYEMGSTNTSNVEISAAQDVIVNGGYAQYGSVRGTEGRERDAVQREAEEGGQIMAGAADGFSNTANVEIFAGRDVIVEGAEVEYVGPVLPGDYGDFYYDGGQIIANAIFGGENTANIGIYAKDDVTIHGATITGEPFNIDFPDTEPFDVDLAGGEVLALAEMSMTNSAEVVICALDDVTVDGDIEAIAEGGMPGPDSAHITIAAGDLIIGTGEVYAVTDNEEDDASITVYVTASGKLLFDGDAMAYEGTTEIDPEVEVVSSVTCPTCDFDWIDWLWCEDCEEVEGAIFAPAAPLVQLPLDLPLLLQGCPVEIEAAANELGITAGAMQVSIGNALALNPTLQACDACATLIEAALILRDEDGSRMAAMTQMFNTMAPGGPGGLPYTPEMQALIATAFAGAAEGSQYASVMEYTDAFIKYFSVLETNLASPVGDSLAFVMDKYGAGVLGSDNTNIAAFLAASLESGKTFGN